jgi:SAM-dependent methyltransferase
MAFDTQIHAGSPDRFGYSWSIFRDILTEHREQFLAWSSALPRETWHGAFFLDAGCGIGRNSYWAMAEGAAGGVAIDVDERSVAIARKNLQSHRSLEVRKQSIYDTVATDAFDIVFSIGVVHHLAEPGRALAALVQAAKPEANVLIWVYVSPEPLSHCGSMGVSPPVACPPAISKSDHQIFVRTAARHRVRSDDSPHRQLLDPSTSGAAAERRRTREHSARLGE